MGFYKEEERESMRRSYMSKKFISLILAIMMASTSMSSSVGSMTVFAKETQADRNTDPNKDRKEEKKEKKEIDKDEMVYVLTDGEGNTNKIIVNDELKNNDGDATLKDKTDLKDIENVKGDEAFTQGSEDEISWDAGGSSISYQGYSEKDLPVDVKLSYQLDGKDISAKDLAGKSGHVSIRFDYKNNTKRKVKVNGKQYEVYVPFTMISGMILDADKFSNVTVENGRALNHGDRIVAFGFATPGLQESLGIGKEVFKDADDEPDLPEAVIVEADVKDFELSMTLTAASCDLLDNINIDGKESKDIQKDLDDMKEASKELKDGANQLVDGAGSAASGGEQVADGANQLVGGLNTLADGINAYTDGVGTLKDKSPALINGVKALNEGAGKLYDGTQQLEAGIIAYVDGTQTLAGGLIGDGSAENPGYLNGVAQLQEGVKQLSELKSLGELNDAILQMKMATSDGSGMGPAATSTLGGAASTLNNGLQTLKSKAEQLSGGTSAAKLKELAGGLSAASSSLKSAQDKVNQGTDAVNKTVESAAGKISNAAQTIETQAGNISDAKEKIQAAQSALKEEVENVNYEIEDRNSNLRDAVAETNNNIDSAVGDAKSAISYAKSNLKEIKDSLPEEAQGEYEAAIYGLDEAMNNLEAYHAEKGESIEKVSVSTELDIPEVSAGSLSETATGLEELAGSMSSVDISAEKGTIDGAASAVSSASDSMGEDPFTAVVDAIGNLQMLSGGIVSGIQSLHSGLSQIADKTQKLPDVSQGIDKINSGFEQVTSNNEALANGAKELMNKGEKLKAAGKAVNQGAKTLSEGTQSLSDGADQLLLGITTLDKNSSKLNQGAQKAAAGAETLASGSEELASGLQTLLEGTEEFRDGINEFDEKAIQKLISLYEEDVLSMKDRFLAIQKAGRQYQTFTKLAKGDKGNVKFVYKSDEIKKEEE